MLVRAAERFGLSVSCYRPSVISGDSHTGYSNTADFENHLLRVLVIARQAVEHSSFSLGWIPVDVCARAIATIAARTKPQAAPAFYHLNGAGPRLDRVLAGLRRRGFAIAPIKRCAWRKMVLGLPADAMLEPYREMLSNIEFPEASLVNVTHSNDNARSMLTGAKGVDFLSSNTDEYIDKVLTFLTGIGFFDPTE